MKILFFIMAVITLVSCGHKHSSDKVFGNIHTLHTKELVTLKKKIIDSMKVVASQKIPMVSGESALSKAGWYSASEMKLPTGTAVDFRPSGPTDDTKGKGPYYIIIRGFDGKQTINKVNYEKWMIITTGDILK